MLARGASLIVTSPPPWSVELETHYECVRVNISTSCVHLGLFQQNAAVARRQNSEGASDGGAPSGGSGCVSVESEGEQGEEPGVRFRVAEEDQGAEGDRMRLHRRDTPHHLKNKRINNQPVSRDASSISSLISPHFH